MRVLSGAFGYILERTNTEDTEEARGVSLTRVRREITFRGISAPKRVPTNLVRKDKTGMNRFHRETVGSKISLSLSVLLVTIISENRVKKTSK